MNSAALWRSFTLALFALLCLSLPALLLARTASKFLGYGDLEQLGGGAFFAAAAALFDALGADYRSYVTVGLFMASVLLFGASSFFSRGRQHVITRDEQNQLRDYSQRLTEIVGKKDSFYQMYFSAVRGETPTYTSPSRPKRPPTQDTEDSD